MPWNFELPDAEWYTADDPDLPSFLEELAQIPVVAIDTETTGLNTRTDVPLYWSLSFGHRRICMPKETLYKAMPILKDPNKKWVLANAKYDQHILANVGLALAGDLIDVQVMHALLHEEDPHGLKYIAEHVLNWKWNDFGDTFRFNKAGKLTEDAPPQLVHMGGAFRSVQDAIKWCAANDLSRLVEYASNDAYGTMQAYLHLKKDLENEAIHSLYPNLYPNLWEYFRKLEIPFTKVLWDCERAGTKIDKGYLATIEAPVRATLQDLEREINRVATSMGATTHINPNSTLILRKFFFDTCGMHSNKLTKGGKSGVKQSSLDSTVLEELAVTNKVANLVLEYRELDKLLGTYIIGIGGHCDTRDRVHYRFNAAVARCLAAGELVLTSRGYLPVENVRIGDFVLSHTGKKRQVINCSTHKPTPIYRVRLSNGLQLRTNGAHPYRTDNSWTQADSLTIGARVAVHSGPEKWRTIPDWEQYEVSSWGRVRSKITGVIMAAQPKGNYIQDATASFYTANVVSIDIEPPEITYGLTVEEDESHVTGGIVTHNTGRLSSSDINIQNIPNPDNDKFLIRKAFVPEANNDLICLDYDALEMRLLAAASMEPSMVKMIRDGKDIHMGNAELVFGKTDNFDYAEIAKAKKTDKQVKAHELPESAFTERMHWLLTRRKQVKAIGFGLVYGMKENSLALRLGTTKEEARLLSQTFMDTYPAIQNFFDETITDVRACGNVYTILGRRRYLPDACAEDEMLRWRAERQATNLPIQGSAADVVKCAMLKCAEAKLEYKFGCRMLMQVHDELLFECPEETSHEAGPIIKELMEHSLPADLAVPLTASMGIGKSWAETH